MLTSNLVHQLHNLRAGLPTNAFNYILIFRLQVYISPLEDDNIDLPFTLTIFYDKTSYQIFLTHDNMVYFIRKRTDHTASTCSNTQEAFPALTTKSRTKPKKATHFIDFSNRIRRKWTSPRQFYKLRTKSNASIAATACIQKTPNRSQKTSKKRKIKKVHTPRTKLNRRPFILNYDNLW